MIFKLNYYLLFISVIVLLSACSGNEKKEKEEVATYSLSEFKIERKDPDWTFSNDGFLIEYEIKDENFVSADPDSTQLLAIGDDTGKDLLKDHLKGTRNYITETDSLLKEGIGRFNNYDDFLIRPQHWAKYGDEPIFKAEILSKVSVPSNSKKKVNVKLNIKYRVAFAEASLDTLEFKIPSLAKDPRFTFQDQSIRMRDNGSYVQNGIRYNYYFLPNHMMNIKIQRLNVYDEQGNNIRSKKVGQNNIQSFALEDGLDQNPVTLEVIYYPTKPKTLLIQDTIDIPEEFLLQE